MNEIYRLPLCGSTADASFPPLESLTRPAVDTATAAYYLSRRPQTLRVWVNRLAKQKRPLVRVGVSA